MSDQFTGAWLVTEYVYNADGSFAGLIHQKRRLEPQTDGSLRVIQQCQPDAALKGHAMADFASEWMFTLRKEGKQRFYLGPDVVGMGLAWDERTITGRGVWTRFAHNFTSFGVMVTPELQITGGKFYNASQLVANIIGVAIPERADSPDDFPTLSGTTTPSDIAPMWTGTRRCLTLTGEPQEHLIERRYTKDRWTDTDFVSTTLEDLGDRLRINQTGIGKRSGWLLEWEQHTPETHSITTSILDAQRQTLIELQQTWANTHDFQYLTFTLFKPQEKENEQN